MSNKNISCPLHPAAQQMIRKVEELSGRPVHVAENTDLEVMAAITTARGNAPAHFLRYRPGTRALDYLVRKITFEIAMLGSRGLDVSDPAEQYSLRSISGKWLLGKPIKNLTFPA